MSSSMTLSMMLMLKDLASGPLGQFQGKLQKLSHNLMSIGAASKSMGQNILNAMKSPISAFMEAEDAGKRLKNALSDKNGVAQGFEQVNKLAEQLGAKLPGNTADFQNLFSALKDNGLTAQSILTGTGAAASYLAVQLKMPFEEAGVFAAKVGKAAGIASKDMMAFMDVIQKTSSMGVTATEMQYAFARAGGALQGAGLQGLKHAEGMSVIFSEMIRGGLSGETVGTNMAAITQSLTDYNLQLTDKASSAKKMLNGLGVELSLFQKNAEGKQVLKGPREMIQELEKLNKLTDKQRGSALKDLFGGGQDFQMVQKMMAMGVAGFDKAQAEMNNKLSLKKKVEEQLKSLTNIFESMQGNIENMFAVLGKSIAPELSAMAKGFSELVQNLQAFAEKHPQITKMATGLALVTGSTLAVGGTATMGLGMAMNAASNAVPAFTKLGEHAGKLKGKMGDATNGVKSWNTATGNKLKSSFLVADIGQSLKNISSGAGNSLRQVGTSLRAIPTNAGNSLKQVGASLRAVPTNVGNSLMGVGLALRSFPSNAGAALKALPGNMKALAATGFGKIAAGFRGVAMAVRAMGLAALGNPLLWIAIAIAGAALLIFKYWKPISGFFKGLWAGLVAGLAPLKPAFSAAFSAMAPILNPIMGALKGVWNWLKNLIAPVDDVGGKAQNMGQRFGAAIAGMIVKVASFLGAVKNLAGQMFGIGQNLIQGLVRGVMSMAGSVAGAIGGVVQKGIAAAKALAGIHSPSRVFMWMGHMMGEGLQLGMAAKTDTITKAAKGLATAAIPKLSMLGAPNLTMPQLASISDLPRAGSRGIAGSSKGDSRIVFAPVIHLNPNASSSVKEQVNQAMTLSFSDFKRMMDRYESDKRRSGAPV